MSKKTAKSLKLIKCQQVSAMWMNATNDAEFERDLHGAALIDESGHEIPLTAAMIDQALSEAIDFKVPSPMTSGRTGT